MQLCLLIGWPWTPSQWPEWSKLNLEDTYPEQMETRSPGVLSQFDSEAREKSPAKAQGQLQDPPCTGKQLSAENFQLDTDTSAVRGGSG